MPFQVEMRRFYERTGYVVVDRVLSESDLAGVRGRTEEILAGLATLAERNAGGTNEWQLRG